MKSSPKSTAYATQMEMTDLLNIGRMKNPKAIEKIIRPAGKIRWNFNQNPFFLSLAGYGNIRKHLKILLISES
jgi:hypothetical protein